MSRIGNLPIALPAKVDVTIAGGEVTVKGPLGTLSRRIADGVTVEKDGETIVCKATRPEARAMHGTTARAGREHGPRRDRRASSGSSRWSASATARRRRATRSTCRSASRTRSCT